MTVPGAPAERWRGRGSLGAGQGVAGGDWSRCRSVAAVVLGVGLGGMAGCASAAEPVAAAPISSQVSPATEARPEEASADDLGEELERALEVIGRVRELAPKERVRGRVIAREEMVDRVQRSIAQEVPRDVIVAQEEMLFALDTVPAEFDYERSLLQLVKDQLAGFYEPEDQTMYLGGDLGPTARWATLAHELVHALQDQHYDLGEHVEYREDGTDEQSAIHALAEGDATSAMFDLLQGRPATEMSEFGLGMMFRGTAAVSSGSDVPAILKRSLVSPYVDGVRFVHWARRRGGWAAVDAIWARPPTSTEQVLHPEKWLAREPAVAVAVPAAPAAGWVADYRDVLGEQSLRLVFEEWMPRFRAEEAAADWGGDRVVVYSQGQRRTLAWRVVFDDEAAAKRAAAGFVRGVLGAVRQGGSFEGFRVTQEEAEGVAASGGACVERADAGPFAVRREGAAVGVIGGPYERLEGGGAKSAANCSEVARWVRDVAAGR